MARSKPKGRDQEPDDDAPLDPADDWQLADDPALDGDYQALRPRTPEDEALQRELDELVAKPGDDPYELNWPDEEVDARTAERAERARLRDARRSPRWLAAAAAGIGTTVLFVVPIALIAGAPGAVFAAAFPIVIVGVVFGIPMLLLIERVTRTLPRGFTEAALLVVGGAIGFGLMYVLATALSAGQGNAGTVRTVSALFMMTATATGFMVAHVTADRFSRFPRAVWLTAGLLVAAATLGASISFSTPGA